MHEVNIIQQDRKQYIYLVALAELVLHSDVKILNNQAKQVRILIMPKPLLQLKLLLLSHMLNMVLTGYLQRQEQQHRSLQYLKRHHIVYNQTLRLIIIIVQHIVRNSHSDTLIHVKVHLHNVVAKEYMIVRIYLQFVSIQYQIIWHHMNLSVFMNLSDPKDSPCEKMIHLQD